MVIANCPPVLRNDVLKLLIYKVVHLLLRKKVSHPEKDFRAIMGRTCGTTDLKNPENPSIPIQVIVRSELHGRRDYRSGSNKHNRGGN